MSLKGWQKRFLSVGVSHKFRKRPKRSSSLHCSHFISLFRWKFLHTGPLPLVTRLHPSLWPRQLPDKCLVAPTNFYPPRGPDLKLERQPFLYLFHGKW